MAFEKTYEALKGTSAPPCAHLRSKAIFVTGTLDPPMHLDEEGADYCWCNLTQHVLGPDDQDVSRGRCVPGRECYRRSS